ncbi:MAG: extracellular solute-binding protein [Candidatus Liptonbacteria bacterium]|nr:extracellular solute-binding protein [Candidatus Liptonbacteria bacterium]
MSLSRSQLIIVGGVIGVVLLIVALFVFGGRGTLNPPREELVVWGVFDEIGAFRAGIDAFQGQVRKNTQVIYERKNEQAYEQDLIQALAAGTGPDILMFHSTWLPKHFDKVAPLAETALPIAQFRGLFPTVVEQDFAPDGIIFALPLYVDTLALYWNKDYFDRKGVVFPPATWEKFQEDVPRLRELDSSGGIVKAAAAIGGSSKSVNRATDMVSLLMLQAGAVMTDDNFGRATFASPVGGGQVPGLNALEFITQFANPASSVYTWNDRLHYSVDNFAEGDVAMIFNYAYQTGLLHAKNPFLKFDIAPMPQSRGTAQPVNFANYWGLAVSKKSAKADLAWQFVKFLATDPASMRAYREVTKHPPALRTLIAEVQADAELGVFARQALTARSWPQIDNLLVERAFSDMIEAVTSGRLSARNALKEAEDAITDAMLTKQR